MTTLSYRLWYVNRPPELVDWLKRLSKREDRTLVAMVIARYRLRDDPLDARGRQPNYDTQEGRIRLWIARHGGQEHWEMRLTGYAANDAVQGGGE